MEGLVVGDRGELGCEPGCATLCPCGSGKIISFSWPQSSQQRQSDLQRSLLQGQSRSPDCFEVNIALLVLPLSFLPPGFLGARSSEIVTGDLHNSRRTSALLVWFSGSRMSGAGNCREFIILKEPPPRLLTAHLK